MSTDRGRVMADNTGTGDQVPDPTVLAQITTEVAQARATDLRNDLEDSTGAVNIRTAQAKLHTTQAATTAAIGSGFTFTPEQIETQLTQCQDLYVQYVKASTTAQRAEAAVHAPAPDTAGSMLQANQTQQSLTNLKGVIQSQLDFLKNWQHTLSAVKARYLQTDHLSESQWQQLAKGPH
ncbi:MAG TPA: hypothetical protein VFX16_31160 [Pseudonocardiaceae bacterium]|nr:hypothetical protein [Pseudonocardiaceae bacterium]